jgi:hypothetical protein
MSRKTALSVLVAILVVGALIWAYRLPSAEAFTTNMYKYDFLCVNTNPNEQLQQFHARFNGWLNNYGANGWELVSYSHVGTCIDAIWKRPHG